MKIFKVSCAAAIAATCMSVITSCDKPAQNAKTYTIEATADSTLNGETFYMIAGKDTLNQAVVADGKFTMTGTVDSVQQVLIIKNRPNRVNLYLEPGTIQVSVSERKAQGTALNDAVEGLKTKLNAIEDNDQADSIYFATLKDFYAAHSKDILAPMAFGEMTYFMNAEELKTALDTATAEIKDNPRYQKALTMKENQQKTAVGTKFIDFAGIDTKTNKAAKLSDYAGKGKVTLVDFWASWCGPCRREIPNVAAAAQKYGKKINVVGVDVWDKLPDHLKACEELKTTWPMIFEETGTATDMYGIEGIPHIMLIGADGTILARGLHGESIETAIEEALKKK